MSIEHEYSQGIMGDGAAILKDGQPMTIEEILLELRNGQSSRTPKDHQGCPHDRWLSFKSETWCEHCEQKPEAIIGDLRKELEQAQARVNKYESETLECCAEILEAEARAIGGSGLGKKMTKIRLQCLAQRLRQQADEADQAGGNQ